MDAMKEQCEEQARVHTADHLVVTETKAAADKVPPADSDQIYPPSGRKFVS